MSSPAPGATRGIAGSDPMRERRVPGAAALVYLLLAVAVAWAVHGAWQQRARQPLLANLEGQVLDWQVRSRGPLAPGGQVAIVMRDERSLAEQGLDALDRRHLAQTIDRLAADGAAWIGVDILLTETQDPANDRALAESLARARNVVLAYALVSDGARAAADGAAAAGATRPAPSASAPRGVPDRLLASAYQRYRGEERARYIALQPDAVLPPLAPLREAARGLGHVSALPALDGPLRHDLPILPFDGEFYPSMAVVLGALSTGVDPATLEARIGESVGLGSRSVPLDGTSQQWINYLGPRGSFPTYSMADLIAGRLPAGTFRGRTVLIGGDALGTGDRNPSPFDAVLPGVERMATVVDNLQTERWLVRPAWARDAERGAIVLLPLLAVLAIGGLGLTPAVLGVGLLAVGVFGASHWTFLARREVVSALFPLIALVLTTGLALAWRALLYERARRAAELRLRASEERFALAARGANDGLWDWDLRAGNAYYSPRARQLLDLPETARGDPLSAWEAALPPVEHERLQHELQAHLDGRSQQLHHELRHERAGETRWLLVRGVAVREGGAAVRMAGSLTDITEAKRLENQVAFDALHDRLTGLPNRDLFAERLRQWVASPPGGAAPEGGLALIDIDGFRLINEVHGHPTGNQVLIEAAGRLQALARERPEGAVVARVGPDQFALALPGPQELLVEVSRLAQARLAEPFAALTQAPEPPAHPADHQGVSVGVAMAHTEHALQGVDELLNGAALALAQGKRQGRGVLRSFDPAEQALQNSRRWLDENIDIALAEGGQFMLHYQPFVRLADRTLIGFEALIRWKHPQRGMVMPNDFIPHAEQSGRINGIGQWTMFEAARQLVAWDRLGFTGEIAVNLSGRQFTETDLEADARQVLQMLGDVAPRRYKLEVTESMAMENPQRTAKVLNRLADLGFKISIDDFGTGYSSLAYLHRFPFDTLKIDRSFVIRLGTGREAQEIVRTVVGLSTALDKQTLAEGVEDEAQAQTLQALGVQIGQGWLFARALTVEAATEYIAASRQAG
jgi:diguanylate cyclase (GGDEF)-like protein/PAS domain S-box-containing protein